MHTDVYCAVAKKLELSTSGIIQQMIEGKLEEEGYQPRNTHIRITEDEGYYSKIELLDSEGPFLEVVNHREEEEKPSLRR